MQILRISHLSYEGLLLLRDDRFGALMSNGADFPNIKRFIDTLNQWLEEALAWQP